MQAPRGHMRRGDDEFMGPKNPENPLEPVLEGPGQVVKVVVKGTDHPRSLLRDLGYAQPKCSIVLICVVICYPVPIHLAQQQPPWRKLSGQQTLNSVRQNTYYFDPSAPSDDLDFVIKSSYDHQRDLFKDKREVLHQRDVYGERHGHIFVNRIKKLPVKKMPMNHPLMITCQAKKENTNSIKTLIGGTHIHTTRQGYSRKPHTGGFFLTS